MAGGGEGLHLHARQTRLVSVAREDPPLYRSTLTEQSAAGPRYERQGSQLTDHVPASELGVGAFQPCIDPVGDHGREEEKH